MIFFKKNMIPKAATATVVLVHRRLRYMHLVFVGTDNLKKRNWFV